MANPQAMIDKKAVEEMGNEELLRAYAWGLRSETRAEILKRMTPRPLPTREEMEGEVMKNAIMESGIIGNLSEITVAMKSVEWLYERITGSKLEEGI